MANDSRSSEPVLAWPRGRVREALLLSGLVLACFVPRAWLCLDREVICSDAVVYMEMARAVESGDWDKALGYLNLNIYPPLLVALRHTGLEWTTAAAWWSVACASFAVLPLFGLARRMFDPRVAVVASLLYAAHPYLLAYSPWMLRDPTHWLLFLLTLYFIWRATAEARLRWFVAAGASLTLAVHLRSEAWLLVLPLVGWAVWRWFTNPAGRRRLAGGTLVSLAMVPASIVVVNLTVLADHSRWEWGCIRPVADVQRWVKKSRVPKPPGRSAASRPAKGGPKPEGAERVGPAPPKTLHVSTARAFRKVVVRMVKALTFTYSLLLLISLWGERRELLRPRDLPLAVVCLVLLLGMAVRMTTMPVEPRYFLVIVLLALPGVARGAIRLSEAGARVLTGIGFRSVGKDWVLGAVLAVVLGWSVLGGWRTINRLAEPWVEQAAVGKWIVEHLGPDKRVVCNGFGHRVLAHYAQARRVSLPWTKRDDPQAFMAVIRRERPDVVVLWVDNDMGNTRAVCREVMRRREQLGYRVATPEGLPGDCQPVEVLVPARGPP